MLPSRGLRPAQFAQTASRQSVYLNCSASRKFSSLPRTASLSAPSCRNSPLQSARWRTGTSRPSGVVLTASSVRNGSWYAPWSWGKSSTPSGDAITSAGDQVPIAQFSSDASKLVEPTVTSTTPEIAPAGIDKAPTVNTASEVSHQQAAPSSHETIDSKTMDELLGSTPMKDTLPTPEGGPTALVDHAGQLKEMGLDYGWGMSTMFEKMIEQVYLQSGWGWAGSIVVGAVGVRAATFFFQALSSDRAASLAALKPITAPMQKKIEDAVAKGDKQQEQLYRMQMMSIMKPYYGGVFSMMGFMALQAWIGFGAFRVLRAMAELPVPGLTQDGFLWFTDLTSRDPYFILPAATTGIFYLVFKTGGETGVANDVGGEAQMRTKLMTGFAFMLGIVTAFQASALQLYFLASGLLGAGTGWLLRQNTFRRLIRIRPTPTKESHELYGKVVSGELRLKDIKGPDGKVRYQAPTPPSAPLNRRTSTTLAGINIREGTAIPMHLQAPKTKQEVDPAKRTHDDDYEAGPQGSILERADYYRRNYKLRFMFRRMSETMERFVRNSGYGSSSKLTEAQEKRKRKAEQYEVERKRRFENKQ